MINADKPEQLREPVYKRKELMEQMIFGEITIKKLENGWVILEKEGGEAMQVKQQDVEQFTSWLQKYYDREF